MTGRLRRRFGSAHSFGLTCGALGVAALSLGLFLAFGVRHPAPSPPPTHPLAPPVPAKPIRLDAAVVLGAGSTWDSSGHRPLKLGEPVPVLLTAYCLGGTTRRGRYVRPGIIAADPKFFPLSRYVELYVGSRYMGRYLVDDTGRWIRGKHIDVWMRGCSDAVRFGRRRGTAVLVPRPQPQVAQAGTERP